MARPLTLRNSQLTQFPGLEKRGCEEYKSMIKSTRESSQPLGPLKKKRMVKFIFASNLSGEDYFQLWLCNCYRNFNHNFECREKLYRVCQVFGFSGFWVRFDPSQITGFRFKNKFFTLLITLKIAIFKYIIKKRVVEKRTRKKLRKIFLFDRNSLADSVLASRVSSIYMEIGPASLCQLERWDKNLNSHRCVIPIARHKLIFPIVQTSGAIFRLFGIIAYEMAANYHKYAKRKVAFCT